VLWDGCWRWGINGLRGWMDGEGEEEEQGDGHVLQDNHERLRRDGERAHLRREKEEEEEEEEEE